MGRIEGSVKPQRPSEMSMPSRLRPSHQSISGSGVLRVASSERSSELAGMSAFR